MGIKATRRWPLFLIAAPAAVAVWSGWVGLGSMCGFGEIHPLPGIWDKAKLNTAITLPIGVESYGAYALYVWLSSNADKTVRRFAQWSALAALALGCGGQVAYHLLAAAHLTHAPAFVTVVVACLPVITLSFAAALAHLTHATPSDETADREPSSQPEPEAGPSHPVASPAASQDATGEATEDATAVPSGPAMNGAPDEPRTEPSAGPVPTPYGEPAPEPEATPSGTPRPGARPARPKPSKPLPKTAPNPDPLAQRARQAYRRSVRDGMPLSDRALGEKFGKGRTWGASRIAECNDGPHLAAQASGTPQ